MPARGVEKDPSMVDPLHVARAPTTTGSMGQIKCRKSSKLRFSPDANSAHVQATVVEDFGSRLKPSNVEAA